MTDFTKYNIHSDYNTDEIILCEEENLTEASSGYWTISIPHDLGFKLLCFALIQLNNDGLWLSAENTTATNAIGMVVVSYSNRVDIHVTTPLGAVVSSVKARVFGLLPSDQLNANITPPTALGKFNINSDYKYDQLVAEGIYEISNNNAEQTLCEHNLGYIPRVMVWQEEVGGDNIRPLDPFYSRYFNIILTDFRGLRITDSKLLMTYRSTGTLPALKIHYRIYGSHLIGEE